MRLDLSIGGGLDGDDDDEVVVVVSGCEMENYLCLYLKNASEIKLNRICSVNHLQLKMFNLLLFHFVEV